MTRCTLDEVSFLPHPVGDRDLTDKPNRNRIESKLGKESKGDIHISVVAIGNVSYGDWGSKWNSTAYVSDHCLFIFLL